MNDPHRNTPVARLACDLSQATIAMVMLHGKGATTHDILGLARNIYNARIEYIAPQAAGNTWYPNSFLAPIEDNEPWLSSAIVKVDSAVRLCIAAGVTRDRVIACGFSQGACLATEYVARNPARYGGLIAFTGGLIGPLGSNLEHVGSLDGTAALLSSGDPDPHVPWMRVEASVLVIERMGARVRLERHPGRPHTILNEELDAAREIGFALLNEKHEALNSVCKS